jgi:tetratricopeptide (TPR) repeat protein
MELDKLKKQLKQELKTQETRKNKKTNKTRWILVLLLGAVSGVGLYPLYQQYQQSVPQRLLSDAIELESLGDIDKAEQIYRKLTQQYTGREEAAASLYRIAKLQQYDYRDVRKALLSYLQLEKKYPDSPLLHSAREESARIIKYSLRDYSQAIGFYQHLLAAGGGASDQYLYEIADCYFRLENYPQAQIELETLIDDYPDSPLIADALYRKGGLLVLENRVEEARANWEQLIENYPQSSYRLQAEFNLAKLLEEEDLLTEALEKYQKLKDFPRPMMLEDKIRHIKKRIEVKKKAI